MTMRFVSLNVLIYGSAITERERERERERESERERERERERGKAWPI